MDSLYYDYAGDPCAWETWIFLFQARFAPPDEPGRIGLDEVGNYQVSTVWLGFDHSHFGGRPVLWETMVFKDHQPRDLYLERYTSRADAERGHRNIVKALRDGVLKLDQEEPDGGE